MEESKGCYSGRSQGSADERPEIQVREMVKCRASFVGTDHQTLIAYKTYQKMGQVQKDTKYTITNVQKSRRNVSDQCCRVLVLPRKEVKLPANSSLC
jgi:hypothetical protein